MKTPEGKIKDKVKALLAEHGTYQFWPVQMGYGARTLDCLACHYGRFLAIETKARGKNLTALQAITRDKILSAGGSVFVVNDEASLATLTRVLVNIEYPYKQAAERDIYLKARS